MTSSLKGVYWCIKLLSSYSKSVYGLISDYNVLYRSQCLGQISLGNILPGELASETNTQSYLKVCIAHNNIETILHTVQKAAVLCIIGLQENTNEVSAIGQGSPLEEANTMFFVGTEVTHGIILFIHPA